MSTQPEQPKKSTGVSGLVIVAGLFIGMGVGFLIDELVASMFIGMGRFCQNSVSGQNSIDPHLLRRSVHVLPGLPVDVNFQERSSNPQPADQKSDVQQNLGVTTADSIKVNANFPVEADVIADS